MTNRDLNTTERATLESIIDSTNVQSVLMALSEICGEKSDHIRDNWQDVLTARAWANACGAIGLLVTDRHIAAIST
jgi:hypothetical protein